MKQAVPVIGNSNAFNVYFMEQVKKHLYGGEMSAWGQFVSSLFHMCK